MSTFEEFERFWEMYPKKVKKKTAFQKFKNVKDLENLFKGLELYIEKWKIEETPKQFIPNPDTFINQERFYDEIIIESKNKDKNRQKIVEIQEEEERKRQEKLIEEEKKKILAFFRTLPDEKQKQIINFSENEIKKEFPFVTIGSQYFLTLRSIKIRKTIKEEFNI